MKQITLTTLLQNIAQEEEVDNYESSELLILILFLLRQGGEEHVGTKGNE